MAHKKVLSELREDCKCEKTDYCPLEELVRSMGDRLLEQHKCVEKFKMEESTRKGKDIGWQMAYELWVERGYAERFAKAYNFDKTFRQIYKEVMNK
jgi:hypothetical protein